MLFLEIGISHNSAYFMNVYVRIFNAKYKVKDKLPESQVSSAYTSTACIGNYRSRDKF